MQILSKISHHRTKQQKMTERFGWASIRVLAKFVSFVMTLAYVGIRKVCPYDHASENIASSHDYRERASQKISV